MSEPISKQRLESTSKPESKTTWKVWVDCGGTFTDIVAVNNLQEVKTHKLLSQSKHYDSAVVEGIEHLFGKDQLQDLISEVRLGTTVATNAFLEKKGLNCALVTSLGFRDALEIRQQNRPHLFDLNIKKTPPLYSEVTHVYERINALGGVEINLDEDIAKFELQRLYDQGVKSLAICLMHANQNPKHELKLQELAQKIGFDYIVVSHQVSPVAKFIKRAETSVVDAYLSPLLKQYTYDLSQKLGIKNILFMKSDGGLCQANQLKGFNALFSGPAGGVVGAVQSAAKQGFEKVISFDAGGTSTDVALFAGDYEMEQEPNFYGYDLLAPMIDIHTVAAGGGSLLKYEGGKFVIGPESAGSDPGPTCYGQDGPLTVTDANLMLGRIDPEKFPHVFGQNRNQALDKKATYKKFQNLAKKTGMSCEKLAEGFLDVAVETMSRAIKKVSIQKGYDPKDFALVSFGGAGGQLAARIAKTLGIKTIFIHPLASILSAYGMGLAQQSLLLKGFYKNGFDALKKQAKKQAGFEEGDFEKIYYLKSKGSDTEFEIRAQNYAEAEKEYAKRYQKVFGVEFHGKIECENIAVRYFLKSEIKELSLPKSIAESKNGFDVVFENKTSIVIEDGWRAIKNEKGQWHLETTTDKQEQKNLDQRVEIEIFYQKFQFIAERMGFSLKQQARSVNIKERNDFSCALLTKEGELLANAPHIPVHLGSMSEVVQAIQKQCLIEDGNTYICNDPMSGGTHLPDITLVTPVFYQQELVMWVASRGHHADIGGKSPGSMPGDSVSLQEEGVVIAPTCLVKNKKFLEDKIKKILNTGPYPSRQIDLNIDDLKAQLAANHKGVKDLEALFTSFGVQKVLDRAESIMVESDQRVVQKFQDLALSQAQIQINDERSVSVNLSLKNKKLIFDFTGTSAQGKHNFNAPRPIVKACVLFVLRSIISGDLPLNDGLLRHVEIQIPKKSLLNPEAGFAVVAGNVETSQVVCDVLFQAFGVKAPSQGTMNNLSFGNKNHQYYETIAGGSGATASASGASGVQVNMTNSLLTDPEVLESRFPVQVKLMGLRRGSGGLGKNSGGDGVLRHLKFLEDIDLSMLSQNRLQGPKGLKGGAFASRGLNLIAEAYDQRWQKMPASFQKSLSKNTSLLVATPGGGGFGNLEAPSVQLTFVFGSNLDLMQIQKRCPQVKILGAAYLKKRRLAYSLFSKSRQGGVADIIKDANSQVSGWLLSLSLKDQKHLDEIECGQGHYKKIEVTVMNDNCKKLSALAYEVRNKKDHVPPTKIYAWLIYSGLYNIGASPQELKNTDFEQLAMSSKVET